jgi:hypothetical protein
MEFVVFNIECSALELDNVYMWSSHSHQNRPWSDTLLKHTPAEMLLTPDHCSIKSNMELKWFELYSPTSELDVDILSC